MYMSEERVKEILDFVKAPPHSDNYGRWGALNPEQRRTISELCNSWLMLNDIVERYRILTGGTFEEPKEEIQVLSRWYPPKEKLKIKDDRLVVDKVLEDGSVTIAKEDKKIKRLGKCFFTDYDDIFTEWVAMYNANIVDKINEIIEKINGDNNE